MSHISRRKWLQTSLLASSALLVGSPIAFAKNESKRVFKISDPLPLHWNENPFGPSVKAQKAIMEVLGKSNRYADDRVVELKEMLGKKHSLSSEEIFITAGSTEVLCLLGQYVGLIKGEIVSPWPTFPTLLQFGQACGASIKKVDLDAEQNIDLDKLQSAISSETSLVFICNPNNPSSRELNTEQLKAFCRRVPENVLICVDEAYVEYAKKGEAGSMVSLVNELPNLIISRTFSKAFGLAGLRVGYAISQQKNIQALRARHLGAEISTSLASVVGAMATLKDKEFLQMCIAKNKEGKQILCGAFDEWGVKYYPSSTNFVYARSAHFDPEIKPKLQKENILITKWPDMMQKHIRISIGKPEEMQQFVASAKKFLI